MSFPLDFGPDLSEGLHGLVFDVDGVLFDSKNSNIEFYNLIRRAVHLPPISHEEAELCHMISVKESLDLIIPPEFRAEADIACRELNYQERILPLLTPEPGLLEALHWLKQWNVRLGIFTNRSTSVEELLRYFGMESFFSVIKTAAGGRPKPDPHGLFEIMEEWNLAPDRIAFLGDSKVDRQAAAAAGVPFWAFRNDELQAQLHFSDFFSFISAVTPLVECRKEA